MSLGLANAGKKALLGYSHRVPQTVASTEFFWMDTLMGGGYIRCWCSDCFATSRNACQIKALDIGGWWKGWIKIAQTVGEGGFLQYKAQIGAARR